MKRGFWRAVVAAAAVAACGGGEGEAPAEMEWEGEEVEQARATWPEGLSARIDSGNVAYREGRYEESAEIFRQTTEKDPHVGATWFGLYMAEHALGNIEAADSALQRAQALTPSLPAAHGPTTDTAADSAAAAATAADTPADSTG